MKKTKKPAKKAPKPRFGTVSIAGRPNKRALSAPPSQRSGMLYSNAPTGSTVKLFCETPPFVSNQRPVNSIASAALQSSEMRYETEGIIISA